MKQEEVQKVFEESGCQNIAQAKEYYFLLGQEALNRWLNLEIEDHLKDELVRLSSDYDEFKIVAEANPQIGEIRDLLFEIISYCDTKAHGKLQYNKYDDYRAIADAFVRMNDWVAGLIRFKFQNRVIDGKSILNAFNYLLNPENNCTILSDNHRKMVSVNLLKHDYNEHNFTNDLKEYFSKFGLVVAHQENFTFLLSSIVYSFRGEWEDEVVGLMASDGTGWQENEIEIGPEYEGLIIWNSKKPSGGNDTLKLLRAYLKDRKSFPLYYSIRGETRYKANIIDFAISQEEYSNKEWASKKIKHYAPNFSDYHDDRKSAKIVFFADGIEKVAPIPVNKFKFFGKNSPPTQDNLSPIKALPTEIVTNVSEANTKKSYPNTEPMSLNQILFGPPGTGKTYNTVNKALEIIGEPLEGKSRKDIKAIFDKKVQEGQIVFSTFHQSMSYEDFIEGIKPITEGGNVKYEVRDGIFKKLCQLAQGIVTTSFDEAYYEFIKDISTKEYFELKTSENTSFWVSVNRNNNLNLYTTANKNHQGSMVRENLNKMSAGQIVYIGWDCYINAVISHLKSYYNFELNTDTTKNKKYVMIIDEINRGNISQIFGELITLMEDDKRLGRDEGLEVMLPYSQEKFGIPPNLYILGTMNTADRSVEALDTALRRRFSFTEMPPRYDLEGLKYEFAGTTGREILRVINKRIEKLLDRVHLIGHSYLLIKNGSSVEEQLQDAFYRNIIPLLQEYFYGDYAKIGAILGKGFIYEENSTDEEDFAADINFEYPEKDIFQIIDYRQGHPGRQYIQEGMTFKSAIQLLVK
ncbi:McrB family protein [Geofilum rubicundum]|uniref:ATPase dynein-related AAA domain-containing protein n=1 Tax=Geofilum rubicundum JCM 15548 TaxID=1236989 RepID=A0A0E9M2H4_9BACT|nr:AAA family ATPase [Geofilum rubicundum]GAO31719.1 hypothetical protein JCM15548_14110 [Geofilum rubicundum JCM 15548]